MRRRGSTRAAQVSSQSKSPSTAATEAKSASWPEDSRTKQKFGIDEFRPGQVECMRALADEETPHDVFMMLPCGTGKTVVLGASILKRRYAAYPLGLSVHILIVPLDAIMEQTVAALERWREIFPIVLSESTRTQVCAFLSGQTRTLGKAQCKIIPVVILASPEAIMHERVLEALHYNEHRGDDRVFNTETGTLGDPVCPVQSITVDEAHCILYWGSDFRTEYLKLGRLRAALSSWPNNRTRLVLMTATAPRMEREAIKSIMGFGQSLDGVDIIHSVRRENMCLSIHMGKNNAPSKDKVQWAFAQLQAGGSLIVFVQRINNIETVREALLSHAATDPDCKPWTASERYFKYHGQMSKDEKAYDHKGFVKAAASGKDAIMIATTAYSMGVNIVGGVRHALLWDPPRCLAELVQQISRVGRDGGKCAAKVFLSWQHRRKLKKMIDESSILCQAQRRLHLTACDDLYRFATCRTCRHAKLDEMFGVMVGASVVAESEKCQMCDICIKQTQNARQAPVQSSSALANLDCVVYKSVVEVGGMSLEDLLSQVRKRTNISCRLPAAYSSG